MYFVQLCAAVKTSGFSSIVPVEKSLQSYNILELNFLQISGEMQPPSFPSFLHCCQMFILNFSVKTSDVVAKSLLYHYVNTLLFPLNCSFAG